MGAGFLLAYMTEETAAVAVRAYFTADIATTVWSQFQLLKSWCLEVWIATHSLVEFVASYLSYCFDTSIDIDSRSMNRVSKWASLPCLHVNYAGLSSFRQVFEHSYVRRLFYARPVLKKKCCFFFFFFFVIKKLVSWIFLHANFCGIHDEECISHTTGQLSSIIVYLTSQSRLYSCNR